jgi:transcriptional regulator with XRE-family HTH domain
MNDQTKNQEQPALLELAAGDLAIRQLLSVYEIGLKLRQLRLRKKIALVDLGKQTGLSASMLSQLENGKLIPTLTTLARIAMVFDVGVDHFFINTRSRYLFSIVRAQDRIQLPQRPGAPDPAYFFECLSHPMQDKSMQCYLAEFPKRPDGEALGHNHDGAEFLYLVEGQLEIRYHDEVHELNAGDTAYFDASGPHCYRGLSDHPAKAIVIATGLRI